MSDQLADLLAELNSLLADFRRIGADLAHAGRQMQESGTPPSESLAEAVLDSAGRFLALREKSEKLAYTREAQPNMSPTIASSLCDLAETLGALERLEKEIGESQKIRQEAMVLLDSVLAIRHLNNLEFGPLAECHALARDYRRSLIDVHSEKHLAAAKELVNESSPLAHLLKLVARSEELDDEQYVALTDSVEHAFGKALAIAVIRGRLVLDKGDYPALTTDGPLPKEIDVHPDAPVGADEAQSTNVPPVVTESPIPGDRALVTPDVRSSVGRPLATERSPSEIRVGTAFTQVSAAPQKAEQSDVTTAFAPGALAHEIAAALLEGRADWNSASFGDLVWRLIIEDRLGLAYHLACYNQLIYLDQKPQLPAWVVRAVSLARIVRNPVGEIAQHLKNDFGSFDEGCFAAGRSEWNHAVRFLLVAAALRPALLAPGSGASSILRSLRPKEGLVHLYRLMEVVADYSDKLQPLDPTALEQARDLAVWHSDLNSLSQDVEGWCIQAPRLSTIYQPATQVWRKWLEPGGIVHSLLLPVRQNNTAALDEVIREIARLSGEAEVWTEIRSTHRRVIGRRRGEDLTGKAVYQIRAHLQPALEFARRWVELQKSRPGQSRGFAQKQAEQLRDRIWREYGEIGKELDAFKGLNESAMIRSGVVCCRRALENLRILFDPAGRLQFGEPDLKHVLNVDLLRIPSLRLNEEWEPEEFPSEDFVRGLLKLICENDWDWRRAFGCRRDLKDHEATERIIEYLAQQPNRSIDTDELTQIRDKHIKECQEALRRDVADSLKQVESAFALGLLREGDRERLAARVSAVERSINKVLRFFEKHDELRSIRSEIQERQRTEVDGVRKRLERSQLPEDHPASARIKELLNKADVLTANEYIDAVLAGLPLPGLGEHGGTFIDFFPHKAEAIAEFLEAEKNSPQAVVRKVRNREGFCGIDMKKVPGAQTDQAADSLDAWFTARRSQTIYDEGAKKILPYLGFKVLRLEIIKSRRGTWVDLETEPISDRSRCPVPTYGSDAHGQYRILCVWDRPTEEDLLHEAGTSPHGPPVLVFHFGRMSQQRRRDLARLCRERRRTFVVIDDTLMVYLAGERGSRMPVLFDCALPFTFVEPYTTTAGLVPVEMFYGRARERDTITDPRGSCFIYGGRQLGKTALLRDVARAFHAPLEGRIALWLDLKAHGIGYDRTVDDIWGILGSEFKRFDVIPTATPQQTGVDKLLGHIQDWLEQDEMRRILLLLDEADRFLEFDAKRNEEEKTKGGEFVRASRLKGLMDRTNRRFKVVFAGLHNVQRTTRLENHPLAHYGEPICIGPLLNNSEWREARALIERPLTSLGFQFASPDLVTRILSQTNYYPSLIQLYCKHLLSHVNDPRGSVFDARTCPPYLVTAKHVEEAYQSRDLRKAIRDRFDWTIQLDQRYEVIAYALAYLYHQHDDRALIDGLTASQIREEAISWWAEGFGDSNSEDAFRALLDEMVGLGVLRTSGDGRYSLRSPNVVSLLGTEDEIAAQLVRNRETPLPYEPATFRSAVRIEGIDPSCRSPLTAQQESLIRARTNGVAVVFGCEAAGLNDVEPFLRAAVGDDSFVSITDTPDVAGFAERFRHSLDKTRRRDGTMTVFVSSSCPWVEGWAAEAVERLDKLKSSTSFVRVLFLADPKAAWRFVEQSWPSAAWTQLSLCPWDDSAVRRWVEDSGFGPGDPKGRRELREKTGNWPLFLYKFHHKAVSERQNWNRFLNELDELVKNKKDTEAVLASFGLDFHPPRKVLRDLAILGEPATEEDLSAIVEKVPRELVAQSLRWADLLRLVAPEGNGLWRLDPLVARFLIASR